MPRHDVNATLLDILLAARRAIEAMEHRTLDEFSGDWKIQSIVLHQLLVLGEAVKRLPFDFREQHPSIDWRRIAGMRDLLIHCYDTVDLETVWIIVDRDLPPFIRVVEPLVQRVR